MIARISMSRSRRALVPAIDLSTSASINYTGTKSGTIDRDDATGGGSIDTTVGVDSPSISVASNVFSLKNRFLFFDSPINIAGGGEIAFWIELDHDLNGGFLSADYFDFYVYLLDEDYDSGFAWNNNPGRIAGEKTLIWNLLGSQSENGEPRRLHIAPTVMVKVSIPAATDVWGVEIAIESYITGSGTFDLTADNIKAASPYPFCTISSSTSEAYKLNSWAGKLDTATGRFPGVSWNCGEL